MSPRNNIKLSLLNFSASNWLDNVFESRFTSHPIIWTEMLSGQGIDKNVDGVA